MSNSSKAALFYKKGSKVGLLHKRYCKLDHSEKKLHLYKNAKKSKLDKSIEMTAETTITTSDQKTNSFYLIVSSPDSKPLTFLSRQKETRDEMAFELRNLILSLPGLTMNCFDIISNLGRGYFGKVLLCRRKNTNQLYAIKVIKKSLLIEENKTFSAKNEREILRKCDNPFIVKIFFAFDTETKLYIGLEYIPGGNLDFLIRKGDGYLSFDDIKIYLAETVVALDYLHQKGIVYRDLKSENILIGRDGHIKLADFGLSKIFDLVSNIAHSFCGTPEFMPPEMINRSPYGIEVDWWQLGILTFDLIYGQKPFRHHNLSKLFEMICTSQIYFPRQNKTIANLQKGNVYYVDNLNKIHLIDCIEQNNNDAELRIDKNMPIGFVTTTVNFIDTNKNLSVSSQQLNKNKNRFSLPLPFNQANTESNNNRITPYTPLTSEQIVIHFISSLLEKNPKDRLKYLEIISHPFFDGIDFNQVMNKAYQPSFIPNENQVYFDQDGFIEGPGDSDVPLTSDLLSNEAFSDFSFMEAISSEEVTYSSQNLLVSRSIILEEDNLVPT